MANRTDATAARSMLRIPYVTFLLASAATALILFLSPVNTTVSEQLHGPWYSLYCSLLMGAIGGLLSLLFVYCRRIWLQYLLGSLSILVALPVAEVVLRLYKPALALPPAEAIYDEELHHKFPANISMLDGTDEGKLKVIRSNSDGFRSSYEAHDFSKHTKRIVLMGDSFAFGVGVTQDETIPSLLEKELRGTADSGEPAVLNAGVVSYSPLLEGILYQKKLKKYAAQVVILLLDASDFANDEVYSSQMLRGADGAITFPPNRYPLSPRGSRGAVFNLVIPFSRRMVIEPLQNVLFRASNLLGTNRLFEAANESGVNYPMQNPYVIFRMPPEEAAYLYRQSLGYIKMLAREVDADGARFVLAVAPRYTHWSSRECPDDHEAALHGPDERYRFAYFDFFEANKDTLGFQTISLLEDFRRAGSEIFPLVHRTDPHYNSRGNLVAAQALARGLERARD